jgi:hypothetical protein
MPNDKKQASPGLPNSAKAKRGVVDAPDTLITSTQQQNQHLPKSFELSQDLSHHVSKILLIGSLFGAPGHERLSRYFARPALGPTQSKISLPQFSAAVAFCKDYIDGIHCNCDFLVASSTERFRSFRKMRAVVDRSLWLTGFAAPQDPLLI